VEEVVHCGGKIDKFILNGICPVLHVMMDAAWSNFLFQVRQRLYVI